MTRRALVPVLAFVALAAAPAHAVVGGDPVDPAAVPWFASVGGCGGTLVAPDRVVTAGHCVAGFPLEAFQAVAVAGVARQATRIALHPDWRRANGGRTCSTTSRWSISTPR